MVDFTKRDTRGGLDDLGEDDEADDGGGDDHADQHGEGHDDTRHGHGDHADHGDHGDAHADHDHHHAHDAGSVGAAVVTVSSTRTLSDDPSGDAVVAAFEDAGHSVVTRELIRDNFDEIQRSVANLVDRDDVDVVVTTGGTGVTPDDETVEAVEPLFDKDLAGFGELFRRLSFDEVGTRVVGTRATAGVVEHGSAPGERPSGGVLVFCLPGSENAARLGVEDAILPEVGHLVGLAQRGGDAGA
jgi:molybdenum cofactor biosynthesis protein B